MRKVILVTGASRGIGRATAILAGEHGWNVGVNYPNDENAALATVEAVVKAGGRAVSIQGNMTREEEVVQAFDTTEATFGGELHSVAINAGINAQIFDTNILGAFLCAREAARRLPRSPGNKKDRSIVFVSSAAARLGSPNEYVDYAGSKGAIDTLTIGLSKELGPQGVRVNAVRPGIIDTEIHGNSGDPGRVERLGGQMPLRRPGETKEVAEAILWLLESKASYVTGAIIDVAGGR